MKKNLQIEKKELETIFDTRKSFYKKAYVIEISKNNSKIFLLKSYDSIVASIEQTEHGENIFEKYFSINKYIFDRYSQTTLRHIKEFFKQFFKNENITKKDLQKYEQDFDFILLKEQNDGNRLEIASEKNKNLTFSTDSKNFFQNTFKGYKQKTKCDYYGEYLFTSYQNGFANYYFYNINNITK